MCNVIAERQFYFFLPRGSLKSAGLFILFYFFPCWVIFKEGEKIGMISASGFYSGPGRRHVLLGSRHWPAAGRGPEVKGSFTGERWGVSVTQSSGREGHGPARGPEDSDPGFLWS